MTDAAGDAAATLLELAAGVAGPPRAEFPARRPDDVLAGLGDWAATVLPRPPVADPEGLIDAPAGPHSPHRARIVDLSWNAPDGALSRLVDAVGGIGQPVPGGPSDAPHSLSGAIAHGVSAVDAEVDSGADLLIFAGTAPLAEPLALISLLCRIEPAALVDYGGPRDDAAWMSELASVRDARRLGAARRESSAHSLCALGSPVLARATAALLQAARRRTPVLLDGLLGAAAALGANTVAPGSVGWWRLADDAWPPASTPITRRLGMSPLAPLGIGAPSGAAGLIALSMLRVAIAARS